MTDQVEYLFTESLSSVIGKRRLQCQKIRTQKYITWSALGAKGGKASETKSTMSEHLTIPQEELIFGNLFESGCSFRCTKRFFDIYKCDLSRCHSVYVVWKPDDTDTDMQWKYWVWNDSNINNRMLCVTAWRHRK